MAHTVQCSKGNVPSLSGKSKFKGFRKNQPKYGKNPIDTRHLGDLDEAVRKGVAYKSGYRFFTKFGAQVAV